MADDPRNTSRRAGASAPGVRAALVRWLYPYALLAAATFLLGAVGGAGAMAATDPAALAAAADAYDSPALLPDRLTTWTVFTNNVVALAVLALGCLSFGLAAVVGLVFNGLVLGAVVSLGVTAGDPLWTLALILPHGAIELGAFFVVGEIAYRVTWRLTAYLRGTAARPITRREFREAAALVAAAVLALAVAAWIEANLTLPIARALVGEPAAAG